MQPVVDQLQQQFPASEAKRLERSTKNGILSLRTCAMGMLLNDQAYVQERIQWIKQTQKNNSLEDIDKVFYPFLEQQLNKTLGNLKMKLLQETFDQVRSFLLAEGSSLASVSPSPADSEPVDELNLESLF